MSSDKRYEDATVAVDDGGITIKRPGPFGSSRTIRFAEVATVTETRLGSVGRWRLIGAGPGGGGRSWYGWDRARPSKESAFALEVGSFWRPTVTPDDADGFREALAAHLDGR